MRETRETERRQDPQAQQRKRIVARHVRLAGEVRRERRDQHERKKEQPALPRAPRANDGQREHEHENRRGIIVAEPAAQKCDVVQITRRLEQRGKRVGCVDAASAHNVQKAR